MESFLKKSANISLSRKTIISVLFTDGIINKTLNDVLKPFAISIRQFNVLRISREPGAPINLETLHKLIINKMSNTTRLVDKLLKKGYVKKMVNTTNRRKIDFTITQKGLNLLNGIDTIIDSTENKIISSLTDNEKLERIRLLGKFRLIAN